MFATEPIGRLPFGFIRAQPTLIATGGATYVVTGSSLSFTYTFNTLGSAAYIVTGYSITFNQVNPSAQLFPVGEQWAQQTAVEYTQGFNNLLPTGPAWPRDPSTVLQHVVAGQAGIWGDPVETLAALLLTQESDPRLSTILLPDWERAWGLPDKCVAEPLTIGDRQTALTLKMTLLGAQSRAFMKYIAKTIGYTITITEYRPFMVGLDAVGDNRVIGTGALLYHRNGDLILDPAGNPVALGVYSEYPYMLGPPENRFYWTVHVANARLTWFRVTQGQTGVDPHLRIGLATDLECLLRRYGPTHTQIIFDYSNLGAAGSMTGTP